MNPTTTTTHRKRSPSHPIQIQPLASTSTLSPNNNNIPTPPRLRPRAYSVHPSSLKSPSPLGYGSSLLQSLDFNFNLLGSKSALGSLCEYVRVKLDEAELDIKRLKVFVEESENEDYSTTTTSNGNSSSGNSSDGGLMMGEVEVDGREEDEDEWEVVTRGKGKAKAKKRGGTKKASVATKIRNTRAESIGSTSSSTSDTSSSTGSTTTANDDISALEQFIQTASNFLSAVKAELSVVTQLSPNSPSSLVQFHLSSDARIALESFLIHHPIPSFPQLHLRARLDESKKTAANSASALFQRVSTELLGLQQVLAHLANLESNAAFVVSCLPSIPSITLPELSTTAATTLLPQLPPPLQGLREYFSAESDRLTSTLRNLSSSGPVTSLIEFGTETTASIVHEATELTSLLTTTSSAAFDEATRIYHAALEGGRKRLLKYEELPFEWKNNPHITSGYRYIAIERWQYLLKSAFEIHNETINIQTHFVGFLSICYLLIWRLPNSPHAALDSHWMDTTIAIIFLGAAMKCLLCSAAWHLLSGCATRHWHAGAACVDYVGISALIAASVIGMEYYGFYCRPDLAAAYITFSAILGISGMILPWKPWFNERKYKMWRIGFFVGLAVSATMPMFHAALLYGPSRTFHFFSPALPSIIAYLVGLTCYALQWPECGGSGRYDLIFASHQLWHCAIVVAIYMHWNAMNVWATIAVANRLGCYAI